MSYIRATIFYAVLSFCLFLAWVAGTVTGPFGLRKKAIAKVWLFVIDWMVRRVCGISFVVKGELPKPPVILAVQHQSAWETIILTHMLDVPAIVLKKELLTIPVFGKYLRDVGMVPIDRKAARDALEQIRKASEKAIADQRYVIIFPEGTRVKYGEKGRIRSGVLPLYEAHVAPMVPVTLDSGRLWPRNSFLKKPGVVTLTFHPPLATNLSREELIAKLESLYYAEK